jgi:hypothetical protein
VVAWSELIGGEAGATTGGGFGRKKAKPAMTIATADTANHTAARRRLEDGRAGSSESTTGA